MIPNIRRYLLAVGSALLILHFAGLAHATQGHGGIEGVYAHQMAHIIFIISMGVLIYWLRERKLVQHTGWRFIQYSALFFILWNLDAITVHALDDQFRIIDTQTIDIWSIRIEDPFDHNFLKILYYIAKLDHLLCVPALLFLYQGLKRLIKDNRPEMPREDNV
jgi:hypothetical protein